jgi:hypothetical protein
VSSERAVGYTADDISLDAPFIRAFNTFLWRLVRGCRDILPLGLLLPPEFFLYQSLNGLEIHSASRGGATAESGELFWINLDEYNCEARSKICSFFKKSVFPPFIEGLGNITCRKVEKTLVVFLLD